MSEYIERKAAYALAKRIVDAIDTTPRVLLGRTILDFIDDIPAADVRPVVRGEWRERRFSEDVYGAECSVCHTTWDYRTNFCPNCGADMRGEEDG